MPVQDHSLTHEFPEFKDDIHQLKMDNAHFKKLYDQYNELTKEVEKMALEILPSTTLEEERLKKQRLQLKDTLQHYIKTAKAS